MEKTVDRVVAEAPRPVVWLPANGEPMAFAIIRKLGKVWG